MPKIVIKNGQQKGTAFELNDKALSIGRNATNDIFLSDKRVSRHHAKIIRKGESFELDDLDSVNGTTINDKEIKSQTLHAGDKIKVGDTLLEFVDDDTQSYKEDTKEITKDDTSADVEVSDKTPEGLTVEMKIPASAVHALSEEEVEIDAETVRKNHQKLRILYQVSNELGSVSKLADLLDHILKIVLETLKADRSFVLLIDEKTGEMIPKYIHHREGLEGTGEVSFSKTIANHVVNSGESVMTSDAKQDDRFMEAQSVIHHGIRSTLCVPLKAKGVILGVIHVDTKDRVLGFTKEDLELLTAICNQASIAIENAKLFDNLRNANKELFEQQNQLVEAAKLSALGLLASGMVHEINNPLHGMSMCTEMAAEILNKETLSEQDKKECLEYEEMMMDKIRHCQNIVKNLLSFARRKDVEMLPININKSVDAALIIAQFHMSKTKIDIKKQLKSDLAKAKADAGQMQQVYLNMIINAMDAMEEKGGALTINSKETEGKWVDVEFSDTGHGIPREKMEEIFKPLFTTKGEGKGTGLGLAICKEIMEKHNGDILVDSQIGKGTTFTIRLPIHKEKK